MGIYAQAQELKKSVMAKYGDRYWAARYNCRQAEVALEYGNIDNVIQYAGKTTAEERCDMRMLESAIYGHRVLPGFPIWMGWKRKY